MTPEEQQIAIQEYMGWSEDESCSMTGIRCFTYKDYGSDWELEDIPDYVNDLNAIHEVEKTLKHGDESWNVGGYSLYVQALPDGEEISATAAQRAEAFLKATNLWKES